MKKTLFILFILTIFGMAPAAMHIGGDVTDVYFNGYLAQVNLGQNIIWQSSTPSPDVTQLHFKMNESNETTVVTDSSTNVITSTARFNTATMSQEAGKIGRCFRFVRPEGSYWNNSDFIDIPDNLAINFGIGEFSEFAWVKTTFATGQYIMSGASDPGLFSISAITSGRLAFYDGANWNDSASGLIPSIIDGNWHHVGLTRSGATYKFWVDGVSEEFIGNEFFDYVGVKVIGAAYPDSQHDSSFNGEIDDVRMYSHALSQEEVDAIYNGGNGTEQ